MLGISFEVFSGIVVDFKSNHNIKEIQIQCQSNLWQIDILYPTHVSFVSHEDNDTLMFISTPLWQMLVLNC